MTTEEKVFFHQLTQKRIILYYQITILLKRSRVLVKLWLSFNCFSLIDNLPLLNAAVSLSVYPSVSPSFRLDYFFFWEYSFLKSIQYTINLVCQPIDNAKKDIQIYISWFFYNLSYPRTLSFTFFSIRTLMSYLWMLSSL